MFGTVARMKVRPGASEELLQRMEAWVRERGSATGQLAHYVVELEAHPDEFLMVIIFKDRDAYRTNADDPDTNRRYQQVRELLTEDPEWLDGAVSETLIPVTS